MARSRLPAALVGFSEVRPLLVVLLWAVAALAASIALPWLRVETSTGSILDRESPEWRVYEEAQEAFGGDEVIVVALEGHEILEPRIVAEVARLSSALGELRGVRRVDSVTTVPLVRGDSEIELDPILKGGAVGDVAGREKLLEAFRSDRLAPGNLVSEDGRVLAVNVLLEKGADEHYAEILARIEREASPEARISGVPVFRALANAETRRQLVLFGPLTVAAVLLVAFVILRGVAEALLTTIPGGVATLLVMGVMSVLDWPVTISTVILPPVLLAVGCAYSIHVIAGFRRGHLAAVASDVAPGIALSSLTTAVGFVGISAVTIDAIRELGAMGALGVVVAGSAALMLVPIGLTNTKRSAGRAQWVPGTVPPLAVAVVALAVGLVAMVGLPRLRVETDVIKWFPPDHQARIEYEWIRERLSGISPVNVVVSARSDDDVTSPEVLSSMEEMGRFLQSSPRVGRALSIADPVFQLDKVARADSSGDSRLSADLVEQYLLLLDSADQFRDLVSADRRAANVVLRVDDNSSSALVEVAHSAEEWWREHGARGFSAQATGIMYEFARSEDAIAKGQLRALVVAGAVIGAILLAVTRSWRVAGAALVANVLPLAAIFGAMGLLGIPVDAGTVLVGNLALGIGVDDSIHIVWGFQRRRAAGVDAGKAAAETMREVAGPVAVTTVVLCAGFGVLGLSKLAFTQHLGVLTVVVLVLCMLADLWLLPLLLAGRPFPRGG